MQELEDLENNAVLHTLQSKRHEAQYMWVQRHKGLVCIPHSRRVKGLKITPEFLEMHTFRPSALLKDHFETNNKRKSCSILVEKRTVTTVEGYPEDRTVKILGEEIGYGKAGEVFRIVLIDGPLVGQCTLEDMDEMPFFGDIGYSRDECLKFLGNFFECNMVIQKLDDEISKFCNNYMVLPGHLDDASSRLQSIWQNYSAMFIDALRRPYSSNARFQDIVYQSMDSYLMSGVHHKVYPVICVECSASEVQLAQKCAELRLHGTLDTILSPSLTVDVTRLDNLTKEVNLHHQSGASLTGASRSPVYLTCDDYIPLLAKAVLSQNGFQVPANIFYMENFRFYKKPADNLSFSLVTLKAVYCFLTDLSASKPAASTASESSRSFSSQESWTGNSKAKERFTLEDRAPALSNMWRKNLDNGVHNDSPNLSKKSNQLMPTADSKSNGSQKLPVSDAAVNSLGDFLAALKADGRAVSFGKQY